MSKTNISFILGAVGIVSAGLAIKFPDWKMVLGPLATYLIGWATPRVGAEPLPDPKP